MSTIIRVIIQKCLHQKKNREDVKNREIRYLPDLSTVNFLSVFLSVRRILNYYHNYPTRRLNLREVKTSYKVVYLLWSCCLFIEVQFGDLNYISLRMYWRKFYMHINLCLFLIISSQFIVVFIFSTVLLLC